jgi:hypothetical protein
LPQFAIPRFGDVLFAAPARVRHLYEALTPEWAEVLRRLDTYPRPGDLESRLESLGIAPVEWRSETTSAVARLSACRCTHAARPCDRRSALWK